MSVRNRKSRLAGEPGVFVKRYGRAAQKHSDPNDRRYDHDIERTMTRLPPADLSDLLADGDDSESEVGAAPGSVHARRTP
ncbi:hypothetical protein [Burkholderia catarinensis]|uniref:hypothetical protein n=1 Tax=Burkholderia catarinensis TaxID=1108140 RepID=UPI0009111039|nr:hypothetical protein [Burkholderia catarinensis]KAG8150128.1 hypothetical protein BFF94_029135 [Burkholderia catarinensis]